MLALSTLVIAASSPTVQLDCGTHIRGYNLPTFDVDAFEGIKFAEARRFAPPEDLDCPDADVFDATAASDMCVQPMMLGMGVPYSTMGLVYFMLPVPVLLAVLCIIFGLCMAHAVWTFDNTQYADVDSESGAAAASVSATVWSSPRVRCCGISALLPALLMLALPGYAWTKAVGVEDCLYLNVYAPASAATATEPLAVMVFIHGGYAIGGSARPDDLQYGSSVEMPAEGVIHVNIQYRLGVMGFLCLNDGETVANVGLLDQLSALRWVQRHIHSFGGDPSRVLLYGHSAGGVSVLALQRMPAAKGLFHAAVSMSPLPKLGVAPERAAEEWRKALEPLGCGVDVACLRSLSPAKILSIGQMAITGSNGGDFGTIPDLNHLGKPNVQLLVSDPSLKEEWAVNENFAVDVPVLMVICREVGDFADVPDMYTPYGRTAPAWPLTAESWQEWAGDAGMTADDAASVYALYSAASTPSQKWFQIGTDLTVTCGMYALAGIEASKRSAPIYLSLFGEAVPFNSSWGDSKYAIEGIDIYLTWGQTAATDVMKVTLPDAAKAAGERFRAYLIEFARTAVLHSESGWKPYPAACDYGDGDGLVCSKQNTHKQACALFDKADKIGRNFDVEMG